MASAAAATREKQTLVASSVGKEGLRGVKDGEGGARKEGKVIAGQANPH